MIGKNVLKFLLVLAVAFMVMLAVRTYAFAIYAVNDSSLSPALEKDNRVLVNKLSKSDFRKGDLMVFRSDANYIGSVVSLPGDTVKFGNDRYVLPNICACKGCVCKEHNCYVVNTGKKKVVVRFQDIVGKAYRIYPIPF